MTRVRGGTAEMARAALISSCERILTRAAREHGAGPRQQVRAAARAFVRRHRRDDAYLRWVLRSMGASSALATALLGVGPAPAAAELAPFAAIAPGPLDGQDVGTRATPALADLDSDGDLDAVSGTNTGGFVYFENTGSAVDPRFAVGANPLSGQNVGARPSTALGDLDGDGDVDLLAGAGTGAFFYFENTGSATAPAFAARTGAANPLDGQDIGANSKPSLGDVDADGDLDFVGADDNTAVFAYYENTGTAKLPAFVVRTGAANPLNGLGVSAGAPALGDLDGDGDLDFVSGAQLGALFTFENTGTAKTPAFIARTGAANPLNGQDAGTFSTPVLGDLDGDGDADLVAGNYDGIFFAYANRGGAFVPRTGAANPLNGQVVSTRSVPALGDLDADGDLDLVVGGNDAKFTYFTNTGTASSPAFTQSVNPFSNLEDFGFGSAPALADIDGDGDLDLFSGDSAGAYFYFQNTGTPASPAFVTKGTNPISWPGLTQATTIAFADLDLDGDLDAVMGNLFGQLFHNENVGSANSPAWQLKGPILECDAVGRTEPSLGDVDGDGDPDLVFSANNDLRYCEDRGTAIDPSFVARAPLVYRIASVAYPSSALGDLDADGDLDLVTGHSDGTLAYLERVRPLAPLVTELTGSANPLVGHDVGALSTPALADLDGDGDADLVAGESLGAFRYFANTGTVLAPAFSERTGATNPLNGRDVGDGSTPALGDLDGDGDFDLLSGRSAGDFDYFANTGTALAPAFAAAAANPLGLTGIGSDSRPLLGDFDRDGDLDLAAGQYYGGIAYFENTGTGTSPAFVLRTGANNPLGALSSVYYTAPAAGDFDRDGDLDVVSGGSFGRWSYLYNGGGITNVDFERRTGALNPLDGEDLGSRSTPASGDLNGDGTPDLVTGSLAGTFTVHYFPEPARGPLFAAGSALVAMISRSRKRAAR